VTDRREADVVVEYMRLGRTGLRVSRIGLGCMSYGVAAAGRHQWTLDEDAAAPLFRQAVDLGVTFWDTANAYQGGTSEEFVGRAVTRFSRREDVVLATKVYGTMHAGPGGSGLSRKAILEQVDESLHRLGTDYIDVYYVHRFDDDVPVCAGRRRPRRQGALPGCLVDGGLAVRQAAARRPAERLDDVLGHGGPVQRAPT
jgi:aryl-alcohol dehydrogenase-like predicted oxidoreductase